MVDINLRKEKLLQQIANELNFSSKQINNVISLVDEGNTVPFIARYRKEVTGALDEVQLREIIDRWDYLQNLEQRKDEVIRLIDEQGKLTEKLKQQILQANQLRVVEDLYRPYKQKRRTRATIAKEKGLEPLAKWMMTFPLKGSLEQEAKKFVSTEKEVPTSEDAIAGAKDIIAEWISDEASYRQWIRSRTFSTALIVSTVKDKEKDDKQVYEMYYDYSEPVKKMCPSCSRIKSR